MKRVSPAVRRKARNIRLLLLDVDGVLTDGRIIIDDRGVETKHFHVRDGQGITLLRRSGVEVGFISGRASKVVKHRARELGITILRQGVQDKLSAYAEIKSTVGLRDEQVAYMGDDIIDLPVLKRAGLAVAVKDGWSGLFPFVDLVTEMGGGDGAVREVAELILKAHGNW